MKRFGLVGLFLTIFLILFGCSSRLHLEPIGKNYGLLTFESGVLITQIPEETKTEMMKGYCSPNAYDITEKETKMVGQYHFRSKILFKCIENKP